MVASITGTAKPSLIESGADYVPPWRGILDVGYPSGCFKSRYDGLIAQCGATIPPGTGTVNLALPFSRALISQAGLVSATDAKTGSTTLSIDATFLLINPGGGERVEILINNQRSQADCEENIK